MNRLFGKKKHKEAPLNGEMSLNITAMADIFTILLVFLLKSYATGAANISPSVGMKMAEAVGGTAPVEALKVEVSPTAVQVEGNPVASLEAFRFPASDIQDNGSSKQLAAALEKERKRQLLIAQSNNEVKVDSKIIVIADQRTPYSTLKAVLASAALHGFTDFKLAVIQKD